MPKLAYVKWLDACYREGDQAIEDLGTGSTMEYYGVLITETPTAVVLAMEVPTEGRTRNPFDILKQNIVEMKVVESEEAFRVRRKRKAREVLAVTES